jgi:hypothetical protein
MRLGVLKAVAIATGLLCSVSAMAGNPPAYLPRLVTGDVKTPTGTYRYGLLWSEEEEAYYFAPPGRPVAWESTWLRAERGGDGAYTGQVKIGEESWDWSHGPLGHAITGTDFIFSPVDLDFGAGWTVAKTAEPIWWGVMCGACFDTLFLVVGGVWKGFINALADSTG